MCGIVGFITNETTYGVKLREAFMHQGLILDTLRGKHATGMFMVEHGEAKQATVMKADCDGFAFTNMPEFAAYMGDIHAFRAVVGHNRYATRGGRTAENAHPFQYGDITLVHNGTINTQSFPHSMYTGEAEGKNITVDSHGLTYNLDKSTAEDVFKVTDGAYATIWHDASTNDIHAIRNSDRPLHFCRAASQDTVFFASEAEQLVYLLHDTFGQKLGNIYTPDSGTLFTFSPEFKQPTSRKLSIFVKKPYVASTYSRGNTYSSWPTGGAYGYGAPNYASDYEPGIHVTMRNRGKYQDENFNWQLVPIPFRSKLLNAGWDANTFFPFKPEFLKPSQNHANIRGVIGIDGCNADAIVVGASLPQANVGMTKPFWSVQPIAINYTGVGDYMVVCRLVENFEVAEVTSWKERKKQSLYKQQNLALLEQTKGDNKVAGPDNTRMTVVEYLSATNTGCSICSEPITTDEADDLFWLSDGNMYVPCCNPCGGGLLMAIDSGYKEDSKDNNILISTMVTH